MNTSRADRAPATAGTSPSATGLIASWSNFWFSPADPIGLHALRVLGGLLFLAWLLPFAGEQNALFGLGGWFDAQGHKDASRLTDLPPHLFSWSVLYLCGTNATLVAVAYWLSIAAIALFTLGLAVRVTGVLTWVAVVSFTANPAISYDADPLLRMLAFYLMFGYLVMGQRRPGQSLIERLLGPRDAWLFPRRAPRVEGATWPSLGANLAVRLFQVHFAIAIVASGLHKLQIKEWWAGLAPWFYLHPPFRTTLEQVQAYAPDGETYLILSSLATYLVLAWQLSFPAFAWRRSWRPVLLGGAGLAFLGCVFVLRMPLFGPITLVGSLSYLTAAEWHWVEGLLARLPGARAVMSRLERSVPPETVPAHVATEPAAAKVALAGRHR
jgi:hypothetical protein